MSLRGHSRFPLIDLSVLLAILLIGWAALRLARIEPEISRESQQSRELPDIFRECQVLFRESIKNPELARREFDLVWHDALGLKAEYLSIGDRLRSDLSELESALADSAAQKGRAELPRRMHELKIWIEKQQDRAGLDRLESRSQELKERIAGAQLSGTNGPILISADLGTLLKEISRSYDSYLSDLREVTNNAGKPLVEAFVAQRLDGARKALAHLSDLADQARRDASAIELFLENQAQSDTVKRTRRQEEIIQAFLEAGSAAEFARRIRSEAPPDTASSAAPSVKVPYLPQVRYVLLAALAGLGVFLIVDLYWRTVVIPLRIKLAERDTVIELQEKLVHFEQLAAGLAHEIRNPLTTINARLYTVQRKLEKGTPEHQDALVIGNEIDRVNQILKNFIQVTRPSPPNLAPMTAGPLLNDVHDLMAPQLHRQAVRLESQAHSQAQFEGDRQQLKQVLINLVQNAAQSIGRDGIIILRARDASAPIKGRETRAVVIEVEDNGPGIRPEVRERLFEPFFSTRKGGTGLGLPISARIVEGHRGVLDFETGIGQGTVFRIALPVSGKISASPGRDSPA